jgi:hypothetical protein
VKPQRSHFAALGVLSLFAISGGTRVAHAAGIEDSVAGAVNLGRAANYVRVNDFMATYQNPANLAVVPGGDLGGELRFPMLQACFDRAKDNSVTNYRQPTPTFQGSEHFGNVCDEGKLFPTGNLGWAQSRKTGWGYGLGFFTPAGAPTAKFGDDTVVTVSPSPNETLPTTPMGVESPNRYLLLEKRAIAGFLMAGVGAQPIPQLRLGLSAGLGFANVFYKNVVSSVGGSFTDAEIVSELHATDWVIPRLTTSIVVAPVESFEIMGQLTYQGDIEAEGYTEITANGIQGASVKDCATVENGRPAPGPRCRIDDIKLNNPLPTLEATIGLRYAKRRVARARVLNPMKDEVFDLEVDLYWSQTSHVKDNAVTLFEGQRGAIGSPWVSRSSAPTGGVVPIQNGFSIPRNWKDTYGVRFGGDWNVIANLMAIRLGVSYETGAVPNEYMNIDFWPLKKVGVHAGLTTQLGRQKFTIAYSHVFYETVAVPVGTGKVVDIAAEAPDRGQAVNEGYYQAALDVISLQTNIAF